MTQNSMQTTVPISRRHTRVAGDTGAAGRDPQQQQELHMAATGTQRDLRCSPAVHKLSTTIVVRSSPTRHFAAPHDATPQPTV